MRYTMLAAVAAVATLSGCSIGESRSLAEAAVGDFHRQLNAGSYQEIYRATAQEFKNVTTEERFTAILTMVHDRLGAFGQADQLNWSANYNNGVSSATVAYSSTFARGVATETFTDNIRDGRAELVNYNINGPALVGDGSGDPPANTAAPAAPAEEAPAEGEGGK